MVPVIGVGAILTVASLLGQAFGNIKSGQEANKQQKFLDKRRAELDDMFNKDYNTPYIQSEQAQSALSSLRNNIDKYQKRTLNRAAITGGSDESQVAANQGANETLASATSDIAGQGTAYKEGLRREKLSRDMSFDQEQNDLDASQRGKWINFMSNAANARTTALMADRIGAFDDINGKISNVLTKKKAASDLTNTLVANDKNSMSETSDWLKSLSE
jgi:hypothetical protein